MARGPDYLQWRSPGGTTGPVGRGGDGVHLLSAIAGRQVGDALQQIAVGGCAPVGVRRRGEEALMLSFVNRLNARGLPKGQGVG